MSSSVFPALALRQKECSRTPFRPVTIHRTVSGREQRSTWGPDRFRYSLRYQLREAVMAPAPWQAYSERDVVLKFWTDHAEWDSFLLVDTWDNVQRRVRFDGEPEFNRRQPGLWEVEIGLVSVVP